MLVQHLRPAIPVKRLVHRLLHMPQRLRVLPPDLRVLLEVDEEGAGVTCGNEHDLRVVASATQRAGGDGDDLAAVLEVVYRLDDDGLG